MGQINASRQSERRAEPADIDDDVSDQDQKELQSSIVANQYLLNQNLSVPGVTQSTITPGATAGRMMNLQ